MAFIAMALPILPGKTERWRSFVKDLQGKWMREYSESRRHYGVHERTFFQSTPQGDMVIVTLEGDDPAGFFARFAQGTDEFTRWFLQQVVEVHGFDPTQAPQPVPSSLVLDSRAGGFSQR